jgi:glycerol-3-phosphate dehydrogenase
MADLPVLCMIGGKWTTFRSFGEMAADMALQRLGLKRGSGTEDLAIGGGRDFPADPDKWCVALGARHGLPVERAKVLLERYGTSALDFAADLASDPMLAGSTYSTGEIRLIVAREQVECLADIFLRRTTIAISGGLSLPLIGAVLDILADHKGWTPAQAAAERTAFLALLAHQHGITLSDLSQTNDTRSALCA